MDFWKRFTELCEKFNVTPNQVASAIGVSTGTTTWWKKGKIPHQATMQMVADYFGVPVSYFYSVDNLNIVANTNNGINNGNIGNNSLLNNNIDPAKVSNAPLTDEYAKDDYEKELLAIFRCLSIKEKNALLNKAYELSELFK